MFHIMAGSSMLRIHEPGATVWVNVCKGQVVMVRIYANRHVVYCVGMFRDGDYYECDFEAFQLDEGEPDQEPLIIVGEDFDDIRAMRQTPRD